jgi:hypothetical protein
MSAYRGRPEVIGAPLGTTRMTHRRHLGPKRYDGNFAPTYVVQIPCLDDETRSSNSLPVTPAGRDFLIHLL